MTMGGQARHDDGGGKPGMVTGGQARHGDGYRFCRFVRVLARASWT